MMDVEDYAFVLDQLTSPIWGPVFQVAIGGGEPTEHPQLIQILKRTRDRGIVPNLTTNGLAVSDEHINAFRKLCGAVAVSTSTIGPEELVPALTRMVEAGVRTNLHFLLSRKSIQDAIEFLQGRWDELLRDVNGIVFLTHKAMGRAAPSDNLVLDDDLRTFLSLVDSPSTKLRFGFDACLIPLLLRYAHLDTRFIDTCEGGFFSVYVDEHMNAKPCSFAVGVEFSFNLSAHGFDEIWLGKFEPHRQRIRNLCSTECDAHDLCRGPCPYHSALNLCPSGK